MVIERTTIPTPTRTLIFYPPPLHTPPIPYQQNHRWYLKPPDTLIIINVCLCSANLCSFFLSKSLRAALFASSSCALCWHHCVYSLWVCFLWVHRWQLVSISNAHFSLDVWFTAPQFCTLVLAKKSNFCPLIRLFIYTCVRLLIEFEPKEKSATFITCKREVWGRLSVSWSVSLTNCHMSFFTKSC